jgi:hypothetical protein
MADAFKTYAKTTKVESIWFYSENDRTFPADVARTAYREYQKNGGHALLVISPAFETDGHFLFSDPAGIEIWREQTRTFLKRIGIKIVDR